MRLNQLDLTRYGKFTDFSIPFGEKPLDGSDLHIIYGPNEAGKSTTFSAILDLLYGIEKRSKYGFKHPYNTMLLGGTIELNGKTTKFTRLKRDQHSLLDEYGSPIADGTILSELGGIDRTAFQTMFSLDDETLEQGGESILASRGELGELLFAASSGLSSLSQRLVEMRAESDKFFKPRGHTHELSQYKKDLEALKAQSDELDVAASTYARIVEVRDSAIERYTLALTGLAVQKARLDLVRKNARAYPRFLVLEKVRNDLEPLLDIPVAPIEWEEAARGLEVEAVKLETEAELNANNLTKVASELSSIVVDEKLLGLVDAFENIEDLRARYVTSVKDLPARRTKKAEIDGAIAAVLRRLERPDEEDAAELILKPAIRGRLEDLIGERAQIDEILRSAETERDRSRQDLRDAEAQPSIAGGGGEPLADAIRHHLIAASDAIRASDHLLRKRLASEELRENDDLLKEQLLQLHPWNGEASELLSMSVPAPEEVERWKEGSEDLSARLRVLESEIERLDDNERTATAQLSVLERVEGLVTDGEAQKVRREREVAWQAHHTAMNSESADIFEGAMRHDDEIGAARLSHVSELARVNELSAQKAMAESQLTDKRQKKEEVGGQLSALRSAVAASVSSISSSLPDDWTVQRLSTWLTARNLVLGTVATLRKASDRIEESDKDGEKVENSLREALAVAGADDVSELPVTILQLRADERIEADTNLRASGNELARLRRDLQNREGALKSAEERLEKWQVVWAETCKSCWLANKGEVPAPSTVRQIFKELEPLAIDVKARAELDYRISAMELDQTKYAEAVLALVKAAGLSSGLPAFEADKALSTAFENAKAQLLARTNAEARQSELKVEAERIREAGLAFQSRLKLMRDHFGVDELSKVVAKLSALKERHDLQARAGECELEILQTLEIATIDDAETFLKQFDIDVARVEIEEIAMAVDSEEGRVRDLFAEKCRAADLVDSVGGDSAVARLEEQRRTILLQIEDGAIKWLRLKLGVAAAEQALRLYREQHRSSLLVRASEAFSLVSRSAYKGLSTQADKEDEVLVAIGGDGSSKRASELSKGTRFQLYLALRVAGYQELVSQRQAIPFIADDILETFDDFRAEETLKVFGQMATFGQVIYLTHHKHLCEIARQVCPGVRIHELQSN